MFIGPFDVSIVKRATEKNFLEIQFVDIRDFGLTRHKVVDDKPFGGGTGMVMKVDVLDAAITAVKDNSLSSDEQKIVLLDARGETFKQEKAKNFSKLQHLILLCGHYEGVDERIRSLVDETISIGDFILTGGEIPAMLITDAVTRLLPGVLKEDATNLESFSLSQDNQQQLEYPQYTTPREYKGMIVPNVLISGNHPKIGEWKKEKAKEITQKHRKDLLK